MNSLFLTKVASIVIPLSLFGSPWLAAAEEMPLWKKVGPWQVRVDKTLNYGCFIFAAYKQGAVLRLGFDLVNNHGYMMIGENDWRSIQVGKDYELQIQFDNSEKWDAPASGFRFPDAKPGEWTFLYIKIGKSEEFVDFVSEFGRKHEMIVFYKNREILRVTLKGSFQALMEVLRCQKAIRDANKTGNDNDFRSRRDPFETRHRASPIDPFEH